MKKTLSVVALLLAVIMIAMCCVACGDDKKSDSSESNGDSNTNTNTNNQTVDPTTSNNSGDSGVTPSGSDSIIGTWKTTIDFATVMTAMMAQQGAEVSSDVADLYIKMFDGVQLTFSFKFDSDNTCHLIADKDSASSIVERVKSNIKENIDTILSLSGMTESDLEAYGYTADQYAELMASQVDLSSMSMEDKDAYYRLDGNKLYFGDSESEISDEHYAEIEISGNTLKIVNASGAEDESSQMFASAMLPLVFTRVA